MRAFWCLDSCKDILRSELRDKSRGLGAASWHRAVLDEAHVVKGHRQLGRHAWGPALRQATAQACFEVIRADCKWCLTGTPIQNSAA